MVIEVFFYLESLPPTHWEAFNVTDCDFNDRISVLMIIINHHIICNPLGCIILRKSCLQIPLIPVPFTLFY